MRRRRFQLPPPSRAHPLWTLLSVAAHAAAAVLFVVVTAREYPRVPAAPEAERSGRVVAMVYLEGMRGAGGAQGAGEAGEVRAPVVPEPRDTAVVLRLPFDVSNVRPLGEILARAGGRGADTAAGEGVIGTGRLLGPAYGDGRLWVRAGEAELGIVGPASSAELHVARVDSAVRAKLKAFIDTMPRDSFALPAPPVWTIETEGGKPWGIDGQWIYLGDIKLPTAILALLPWPQGNYEQSQRAAELARMREDILQAARRAQTAEDFRRYVDETRKRRDQEREFRRAVEGTRARRDTIKP